MGMVFENVRDAHPHLPDGRQLDLTVVDGKLTAAVSIVPPQALLPQESAVERRLHFVHAQVLRRRPHLAPERHLLVVPHRAFTTISPSRISYDGNLHITCSIISKPQPL